MYHLTKLQHASDLAKNFAITNNLFSQSVADTYTATSNQKWLIVTNNTGNLSDLNQLSVALDESQIKAMPNGTYLADIVVSTSNNDIFRMLSR